LDETLLLPFLLHEDELDIMGENDQGIIVDDEEGLLI